MVSLANIWAAVKRMCSFLQGDANVDANPNIQGIAYTNSVIAPTSTQQFGIDADLGILATVANNAGTLVTVGDLGVDFAGEVGFDISGFSNIAYASLETAGAGNGSELFSIDLGSGAASSLGSLGGTSFRSLAVVSAVPEPSSLSLLALGMTAIVGRRRRNS